MSNALLCASAVNAKIPSSSQPQYDIIQIATAIGVIGTLLLGFITLYMSQKNDRKSREHNLRILDYEKRRDYMLTHLSEYITLFNAHDLSFLAHSDEEMESKNKGTHECLYHIETIYHKIQLMLNPDNICFEEFSNALSESLALAKALNAENSQAEFMTNMIRTPEKAIEVCEQAFERLKKSNEPDAPDTAPIKDVNDYIRYIVKSRDEHLRKYLAAVTEFDKHKETLVLVSRKYLVDEKGLILKMKRRRSHA